MNNKQIAIIGLGWLGLPLAKHFVEHGAVVRGSTTSTQKFIELLHQPFSIRKIHILKTEIIGDFNQFLDAIDILIINIPPSSKSGEITEYPAKIEQIAKKLPKECKVVFVSSTSVYGNHNVPVNEENKPTPTRKSGKAVLSAENILKATLGNRLTIVRFAGLFGPDRHPGSFLKTKNSVSNPNGYINLIHQVDCIRLITAIIQQRQWGQIINGCADEHPKRSELYTKAAQVLQQEIPKLEQTEPASFKIVENNKSKELLNFTYQYNDPLLALNKI